MTALPKLHPLRAGLAAALLSALALGAQAQTMFNAATYNLRLNLAQDGPNAWPQRKEAVKALIRYHEFDLLGTQEGLPEQIDDLAALKDRIDYIFLGPRWRVLRYAALTDTPHGRFPSDHLPVVARVALD